VKVLSKAIYRSGFSYFKALFRPLKASYYIALLKPFFGVVKQKWSNMIVFPDHKGFENKLVLKRKTKQKESCHL